MEDYSFDDSIKPQPQPSIRPAAGHNTTTPPPIPTPAPAPIPAPAPQVNKTPSVDLSSINISAPGSAKPPLIVTEVGEKPLPQPPKTSAKPKIEPVNQPKPESEPEIQSKPETQSKPEPQAKVAEPVAIPEQKTTPTIRSVGQDEGNGHKTQVNLGSTPPLREEKPKVIESTPAPVSRPAPTSQNNRPQSTQNNRSQSGQSTQNNRPQSTPNNRSQSPVSKPPSPAPKRESVVSRMALLGQLAGLVGQAIQLEQQPMDPQVKALVDAIEQLESPAVPEAARGTIDLLREQLVQASPVDGIIAQIKELVNKL